MAGQRDRYWHPTQIFKRHFAADADGGAESDSESEAGTVQERPVDTVTRLLPSLSPGDLQQAVSSLGQEQRLQAVETLLPLLTAEQRRQLLGAAAAVQAVQEAAAATPARPAAAAVGVPAESAPADAAASPARPVAAARTAAAPADAAATPAQPAAGSTPGATSAQAAEPAVGPASASRGQDPARADGAEPAAEVGPSSQAATEVIVIDSDSDCEDQPAAAAAAPAVERLYQGVLDMLPHFGSEQRKAVVKEALTLEEMRGAVLKKGVVTLLSAEQVLDME